MVPDFLRDAEVGREIGPVAVPGEGVDIAGTENEVRKLRIQRIRGREVVHGSGLVHIFYRHYRRVAVLVVYAARVGRSAVGRHLVCVLLSVVLGEIAETLKHRHFQSAGDDDSGLRDMGDGGQVGVEGMRLASVPGRWGIASGGIDADVLVGPVLQFGMRPAGAVICCKAVIHVSGPGPGGIEPELGENRVDLREVQGELGSGPVDVGPVGRELGLAECVIGHLDIHRGPVFLVRGPHIDLAGLAVHPYLRVVRHGESFRNGHYAVGERGIYAPEGVRGGCLVVEAHEGERHSGEPGVDSKLGIAVALPAQVFIEQHLVWLGIIDIGGVVPVREAECLDIPVLLFRIENVE